MKAWLSDSGISQRQLAELMNLTASTINGKVNGWIAWQPDDLTFLHDRYGLSSDFVLGLQSWNVVGKE